MTSASLRARQAAFTLALLLSLGADASAQTAPAAPSPPPGSALTTDQRALAEMLFYTGKGMMGEGRIAEACPKFAESYRLDPAAGTLLNLAVCHEKEGKIASAWGEFRDALADARKANRQDRIDLATEAIARLEPDLPYVSIVVPPDVRVPGLEVRRNGVPLQEGAWATDLPIDPGVNEIAVSAPHYKSATQSVKVARRDHATVTLLPLAVDVLAIPPPPWWTTKRKAGLGLVVGGVVAAGVGAVFGGLALSEKSTSNASCPTFDQQLRCYPAGSSAASTAQTYAWVSDFGVGVGVAALAAGGLLLAVGGAHENPLLTRPAQGTTAGWTIDVAPSLQGRGGGRALLTRAF